MLFRHAGIPSSEITPQALYWGRRDFIRQMGGLAAVAVAFPELLHAQAPRLSVAGAKKSGLSTTGEAVTPFADASTYNNYYEFARKKELPAQMAGTLRPAPWTIAVEGETAKAGRYAIEDLIKTSELEERVYRHRCVEGWSMVIPWTGVPLKTIVDRLQPSPKARFIEMTTLNDPEQLPGLKEPVLPWPYVEALRLDEARHPLTLLAVGMYGQPLPNQNGAPIRLVVPWKYGFKGVKSIVKIRFTEEQPKTTWNIQKPHEYGFYANVNPQVDHPRWTQARERRIGELFKRETLMFNGYADQVAWLYTGLDLKTNY
jgi:sulfoxide reductase catalytic subunit YedY